MIKKILVYCDGSAESYDVLMYSIILGKTLGSDLHLVYVVNLKLLEDLLRKRILVKSEELEYENDLEADARKFIKFAARLAGEKGVALNSYYQKGDVNKIVLHKALEIGVDLIVVGPLKEFKSIKDVSYDETALIVRGAPMPVLVVKEIEGMEDIFNTFGGKAGETISGDDNI